MIAGRLGDIAEAARAAGARSPAVLISGPTVSTATAPLNVRRVAADARASAELVAVDG